MPAVTIGLVIHNESLNLPGLLQNLEDILIPDSVDILIVDNASTDSTPEIVKKWQDAQTRKWKTSIISRRVNNLAEARNDVIQNADTEWIFFTDADCRLSSESWQKHLDFIDSPLLTPRIAAFGGGNRPCGPKSFMTRGLQTMSLNGLAHMGSIQLRSPRSTEKVSLLSTCNLMLRTRIAQECGGCDTRFHPVGEDLSLCHRLLDKGYSLLAVPHITVDHYQTQNLKIWSKKMFRYGGAQIKVAQTYPRHLRGPRGLQLLGGLLLSGYFLIHPLQIILFLGAYAALFILLSVQSGITNGKNIFSGMSLSFISHACYFAGEVDSLGRWLCSTLVRFFPSKFQLEKE